MVTVDDPDPEMLEETEPDEFLRLEFERFLLVLTFLLITITWRLEDVEF